MRNFVRVLGHRKSNTFATPLIEKYIVGLRGRGRGSDHVGTGPVEKRPLFPSLNTLNMMLTNFR